MKWWQIILIPVILLGGVWAYRYFSTPPPGTKVEEMGREHVSLEQVEKTTYSSNPPTSGPHVPTWIKPGLYDKPQHDGELIHSLEHGYIEIHYNCNASRVIKELSLEATGSALSDTDSCKTLVRNLTELAQKKRLWKLIVVPRPNLDTTIALTAWGYIDKFDPPASGFEAKRIETFIDYHRDHGPEQTME